MPRLALLILLSLAFALPVFAQDDADVKGLINELASEDWATRERASRKLVGLGEDARTALREALEHDDPEVRVRSSAALIAIGEGFAYAVECATGESEHLREHGRAALMNLFRIDDDKILRGLNQRELQTRWTGQRDNLNLQGPPPIVLARLQAVSGVRLLVASDARELWRQILEQPTARINISGDIDQIPVIRDGIRNFIQSAQGNIDQEDRLIPRPLRLGRSYLIYVTRGGSGALAARRCGDQLIDDLLTDGEQSLLAAALLGEAAATDTEASDRIREQYLENPGLSRLMWLALALGHEESLAEIIRERNHDDAISLLKTRDWTALELIARYLRCLQPDRRGAVLGDTIAGSRDSLELTAAVWMARGARLDAEARARVGRLVSSKQDMLAASAARWFAGADDVTDAELELIWQAGEFQPLGSSFFTATLELVGREEVSGRLVGLARQSLTGIFHTQQALAAAVLAGRTNETDLEVALDKLNGARNLQRLALQLAEMFDAQAVLTDEATSKFISGLTSSDKGVRDVYMLALRRCAPALRVRVARLAHEEINNAGEDDIPQHHLVARVSLHGVLAGAGEDGSLDNLIDAVESEEIKIAGAAGAAFVDAFKEDELFKALDDLREREGITHGQTAALEGYMEICRRAVYVNDRVRFRKAYGVAINMQVMNQNWQLRNDLMRMQNEFPNDDGNAEQPLPPDPVLKQLDVQVS